MDNKNKYTYEKTANDCYKDTDKMKRFFLIIICVIFLVSIYNIFKPKNNVFNKLSDTKVIVVNDFEQDDEKTKKITDSNDIKQIIRIISNGIKMSGEESLPYRKLPHYILKLMDRNNSIIVEIKFFNFKNDISWISFNNDDLNKYIIDADSLANIIN